MEPIRHEKSKLCVRCKTGERGLLLGMISKSILHAFDGYVNNQAGTNKKIVDDVYKRGDRAFNTGMFHGGIIVHESISTLCPRR